MKEFLIHPSIAKKYARQTKMIFYADRKEALTVFETGDRNEAVFSANNNYGEFISGIVLRNLIKLTAKSHALLTLPLFSQLL
jgi:HEPN domain-containing protein